MALCAFQNVDRQKNDSFFHPDTVEYTLPRKGDDVKEEKGEKRIRKRRLVIIKEKKDQSSSDESKKPKIESTECQ